MSHFRPNYTASGRAAQSWSDLDISIPYGATGELRTTCPQCAPNRRNPGKSLSIHCEKGIWFCHYCGWRGSLARPGIASSSPRPGPRQRSPDDIQRRQAALERIWQQAHAVSPTDPVARYLQRRGLWDEPVPSSLRCHPRLPYTDDRKHFSYHPALIASIQDQSGAVVSLHRIYLTTNGNKANVPTPKKSMPATTTVSGAAVHLDTPTDTLAVCEGVETGLALRRSAGVPVWACLSAGGLASVVLPDSVALVLICGDNDDNRTGEKKAHELARRLLTEGRRVKIMIPQTPGADWADGMEGISHD